MRDVQKKRLAHPLALLLKPFGTARRVKSSGATGKRQQPLFPTVRTPDPGKPAARVAAVQALLHNLLDDRPEITVLPLEATLILGQEAVEVMEQDPIKDGPLGMPRTIDSRHGGRKASRNGPTSWIGPRLPEKQEEPRLGFFLAAKKNESFEGECS